MAEEITTAPMPPRQPRPSLVVGGPAYFTPEGYQAPVQPEQAFMPTDTKPDPIGENFRRQYPDRPMPPPPMPTPQPQPEPPFDPGPITGQPVYPDPITAPAPQPEYNPYAQTDLGKRALGGEYINSKTFHWFDPTTGKTGSTTEGWSRVPDSVKGYTYLDAESASNAQEKFRTFEDRGETPEVGRTPVTNPAPAESTTLAPKLDLGSPGSTLTPEDMASTTGEANFGNLVTMAMPAPTPMPSPASSPVAASLPSMFGRSKPIFSGLFSKNTPAPAPMPAPPMKTITIPGGQTVQIPDINMEQIQASLAGLNIPGKSVPPAPMMPAVPPMMPAALDVAPVAPPSLAPRMPPMMPSLSPNANRRIRDPRFER